MMQEYKSQRELYLNLLPALNGKIKHLNKSGFKYITREDIWNYLKENKWKYGVDLTLSDMVQDIIHTDNLEINNFVNGKKAS